MTTSTASHFLSGLFSTGLGKITVMVFGLAGLMVVTRTVDPVDVGTFLILQAVVILLTEMSSLGVNLTLPKLIIEANDGEKRRLISTVFWGRLFTLGIASIIALTFAQDLFRLFGSTLDERVVLFIPLLVITESFIDLNGAVYQGHFRFGIIGAMNGASSLLNFAGIVALALFHSPSVLGLIWVKLFARGLVLIVAWFIIPVRVSFVFDRSVLGRLIKFGVPLEINYVMSFLFQRLDTFIVGILLGPAQVAIYEVAKRIPGAASDAYEAFVQVYFPFMSRLSTENKGRASNLLNRTTRWMVFGGLFGALIATLFGTQIVTLLFSDRYAASGPVFGLLMVSMVVVMLDSNMGYALIANHEGRRIPVINGVRTALIVVGYFILIPLWGLVGAALTGVLSILAVNPLPVYFLRKIDIRVKTGSYVKALLLFSSLVAVFFALNTDSLLVKIVLIVLFPLISFALSIVTVDDVVLMTSEVRKAITRVIRRLQPGKPLSGPVEEEPFTSHIQ